MIVLIKDAIGCLLTYLNVINYPTFSAFHSERLQVREARENALDHFHLPPIPQACLSMSSGRGIPMSEEKNASREAALILVRIDLITTTRLCRTMAA